MNAEGIMLAVGVVIRDADGRILLVRHRPERGGFWQGKWICPGGKLDSSQGITTRFVATAGRQFCQNLTGLVFEVIIYSPEQLQAAV